jgi:phosphate starvation-inducible PhoH-like protein
VSSAQNGPSGSEIEFSPDTFQAVLGELDANLKRIESTFGVRLVARDGVVRVEGEPTPADACSRFLEQLSSLAEQGFRLTPADVAVACRVAREAPDVPLARHFLGQGIGGPGQRQVRPRTARQGDYLDRIADHDVVFAIGPAGTGKTYLAVAAAIQALGEGRVRRLVLCRPAVEAGERLGFLPGDLAQKVNPYLRPLYDALYDIWTGDRARRMIDSGTVEVAPLAYMRGRTLNQSFIILDEAQNTTREQMKMFLTRIGEGSKAIVTGDVTQIDLPVGKISGLVHARRVVEGTRGIAVVDFGERDVVRHELVQRIVRAYEVHEEREAQDLRARAADGDAPDPAEPGEEGEGPR